MFGGRVSEEHRTHVTDWWVEVMGGPAAYTERRGGYEHMLLAIETWRSQRNSAWRS
jgi:hemoglobin